MCTSAGRLSPLVGGLQITTTDFPCLPSVKNVEPIGNTSLPFTFADSINLNNAQVHQNASLRKEITIVEGIPLIKWTEKEVNLMNQIERLQYAVIGKFTFDWADLDELRKIIPQQCRVKGSCQIGLSYL
ncbi:hypothetical protein MTR67_031904 [Solanum verrucosum]|uniref:Uncharacterized protein n=1 Tax=Solanum verrucosum TaxID=315347 RepID=A0AAF0U3E2_SOLVR|nr:hypothetical protein MTR67_031904 [Solanum verrucosum]